MCLQRPPGVIYLIRQTGLEKESLGAPSALELDYISVSDILDWAIAIFGAHPWDSKGVDCNVFPGVSTP